MKLTCSVNFHIKLPVLYEIHLTVKLFVLNYEKFIENSSGTDFRFPSFCKPARFESPGAEFMVLKIQKKFVKFPTMLIC